MFKEWGWARLGWVVEGALTRRAVRNPRAARGSAQPAEGAARLDLAPEVAHLAPEIGFMALASDLAGWRCTSTATFHTLLVLILILVLAEKYEYEYVTLPHRRRAFTLAGSHQSVWREILLCSYRTRVAPLASSKSMRVASQCPGSYFPARRRRFVSYSANWSYVLLAVETPWRPLARLALYSCDYV